MWTATLPRRASVRAGRSRARRGERRRSAKRASDTEPHLFWLPPTGRRRSRSANARAGGRALRERSRWSRPSGDDAERLRRAAGADQRDDMREVQARPQRASTRRREPRAARRQARRPPGPGSRSSSSSVRSRTPGSSALRATGVRVVTYMAAERLPGARRPPSELAAVGGPARRRCRGSRGRAVHRRGQARRRREEPRAASGWRCRRSRAATAAAARAAVGRPGPASFRDVRRSGPFRTQYVEADAAGRRAIARDPGVVCDPARPRAAAARRGGRSDRGGRRHGPRPARSHRPRLPRLLQRARPRHRRRSRSSSTSPTRASTRAPLPDRASPTSTRTAILANPSRIAYADDFAAIPTPGTAAATARSTRRSSAGSTRPPARRCEDAAGFNYDLGVAPRAQARRLEDLHVRPGAFELEHHASRRSPATAYAGAPGSRTTPGARTAAARTTRDRPGVRRDRARRASRATPGNQEMVEVFAAGNDGVSAANYASASPGTAKNVITVGACREREDRAASLHRRLRHQQAARTTRRTSSTSRARGPTDDGRIKPDVVAPGTHIAGTAPGRTTATPASGVCSTRFPPGSTLYSQSSGTSHSTPGRSPAWPRSCASGTARTGAAAPSCPRPR